MNEHIRQKMKRLGVTQVELIKRLHTDYGITVQPPEMSQIISGVNTYPKAQRVLDAVETILAEMDN